MTAAIVGEVEVVASEFAVSPLTTDPEKPIYYRQVMRLLLADGSEMFGCLHCDYTGPTTNHIWPHLKAHKDKTDPIGVLPQDMTIGELFREHQRAEAAEAALARMTESRNDWKQRAADAGADWKRRALDAERKLSALQVALRGVSL